MVKQTPPVPILIVDDRPKNLAVFAELYRQRAALAEEAAFLRIENTRLQQALAQADRSDHSGN